MCVGCLFESGDVELKRSVSVGAKVHLNQTIAVGAWGIECKRVLHTSFSTRMRGYV